MMISRRPKMRRSSENHPGPSRPTAAATTARYVTAADAWSRSPIGARDQASSEPNAVSTIVAAPIGVRNPTTSDKPPATVSPAGKLRRVSVSWSARYCQPCTMAPVPASRRSSRIPIPGVPAGNVEKSHRRRDARREWQRSWTTLLRLIGGTASRIPLLGYAATGK